MVPSPATPCQRIPAGCAGREWSSCPGHLSGSSFAGFAFRPGLVRREQLVADAADGRDHRLVLGAELGPEAADVDVDRAGAAEEVVAPDLLEELGPGRDPAGPGGQEPQQLELLVGQVEGAAAEADLVGDGV